MLSSTETWSKRLRVLPTLCGLLGDKARPLGGRVCANLQRVDAARRHPNRIEHSPLKMKAMMDVNIAHVVMLNNPYR